MIVANGCVCKNQEPKIRYLTAAKNHWKDPRDLPPFAYKLRGQQGRPGRTDVLVAVHATGQKPTNKKHYYRIARRVWKAGVGFDTVQLDHGNHYIVKWFKTQEHGRYLKAWRGVTRGFEDKPVAFPDDRASTASKTQAVPAKNVDVGGPASSGKSKKVAKAKPKKTATDTDDEYSAYEPSGESSDASDSEAFVVSDSESVDNLASEENYRPKRSTAEASPVAQEAATDLTEPVMSGARVGAKRDRETSPDPLQVAFSDEDGIISSKPAKKARAVQQPMDKEDVMKSLADLDYKEKKLDCKEKKLDIAKHRRELREQVSTFTRTTVRLEMIKPRRSA
ncbi:MAG: hypothetical protein Q9180_008538 [Flavoplaca navasiana]